jgi:molybdenum cofactor cytidylyltransferase
MSITGDVGARHIIGNVPEAVVEVPISDASVTTDVDTPDVLESIRAGK